MKQRGRAPDLMKLPDEVALSSAEGVHVANFIKSSAGGRSPDEVFGSADATHVLRKKDSSRRIENFIKPHRTVSARWSWMEFHQARRDKTTSRKPSGVHGTRQRKEGIRVAFTVRVALDVQIGRPRHIRNNDRSR